MRGHAHARHTGSVADFSFTDAKQKLSFSNLNFDFIDCDTKMNSVLK